MRAMGERSRWWASSPAAWVRSYLRVTRDSVRAERDEQLRTDTHRTLTNVTTSARRVLDAPADAVWALLPDVAYGPDVVATFVVPGTPTGEVGECRCVLTRRPDGALVGVVHELLAIEPGRARVYQERQEHQNLVTTTTVEPASDLSCEVAVWFTFQTSRKAADEMRARAQAIPRGQLDRLADHLAGTPATPAETRSHDESDLVGGEVLRSAVVDASVEAVWAAVRPAEQARLDTDDPAAVTFTAPGTPRGEVGEQICMVVTWTPPAREVTMVEVVAEDPGRSFTVRSLSTAHLLTRTVVVKPVAGGTEVSVLLRMLEHEARLKRLLAERSAGVEAYLDRICAAASRVAS